LQILVDVRAGPLFIFRRRFVQKASLLGRLFSSYNVRSLQTTAARNQEWKDLLREMLPKSWSVDVVLVQILD